MFKITLPFIEKYWYRYLILVISSTNRQQLYTKCIVCWHESLESLIRINFFDKSLLQLRDIIGYSSKLIFWLVTTLPSNVQAGRGWNVLSQYFLKRWQNIRNDVYDATQNYKWHSLWSHKTNLKLSTKHWYFIHTVCHQLFQTFNKFIIILLVAIQIMNIYTIQPPHETSFTWNYYLIQKQKPLQMKYEILLQKIIRQTKTHNKLIKYQYSRYFQS